MLLVAALLAACDRASDNGSTAEAGELRSTIARAPGGGSTELAVHAVNDLGATLHRAAATAQPAANLVLAPASLGIALAIARTGAAGVTATEMDHVLEAVDPTALAPSMNALDQALAARSGTRPDASGTHPIEVALQLVRALWVQQDLPWSKELLDQLAESYGAGLHTTDFTAPRRRPVDDQRLDPHRHRRPGPGDPPSWRHRPHDHAPPARRRPLASPVADTVRVERHGRRGLHPHRWNPGHRPDDALCHPAGVPRPGRAGRRSTCPTPATS